MSTQSLQWTFELGSYQTGWATLHRLRSVLVRPDRERLSGRVEVDETFFGSAQPGLRGFASGARRRWSSWRSRCTSRRASGVVACGSSPTRRPSRCTRSCPCTSSRARPSSPMADSAAQGSRPSAPHGSGEANAPCAWRAAIPTLVDLSVGVSPTSATPDTPREQRLLSGPHENGRVRVPVQPPKIA